MPQVETMAQCRRRSSKTMSEPQMHAAVLLPTCFDPETRHTNDLSLHWIRWLLSLNFHRLLTIPVKTLRSWAQAAYNHYSTRQPSSITVCHEKLSASWSNSCHDVNRPMGSQRPWKFSITTKALRHNQPKNTYHCTYHSPNNHQTCRNVQCTRHSLIFLLIAHDNQTLDSQHRDGITCHIFKKTIPGQKEPFQYTVYTSM